MPTQHPLRIISLPCWEWEMAHNDLMASLNKDKIEKSNSSPFKYISWDVVKLNWTVMPAKLRVVDSFLGNKAATSMICKIHWQLKLCVPLTSWRAGYSKGHKQREAESQTLHNVVKICYIACPLYWKFLSFLYKEFYFN